MKRHLPAFLMMAIVTMPLFAQGPAAAEKIPVKVQVVISRWEGDRKVSSLPNLLLAVTGSQVSLLNGTNVPINTGANAQYTNIGTTITCTVTAESGMFKVAMLVDDKAPLETKPTGNSDPTERPSYKNFNYQGIFSIKDGETKQITSASDKITGQTWKIDVTLTVDK